MNQAYTKMMTDKKKGDKRDQTVIHEVKNREDEESDSDSNKEDKLKNLNSSADTNSSPDQQKNNDDLSSYDSDMDEAKMMEQTENVFQQLLGLPEVSIETLYLQHKEKDKNVLKLMNEHTNFIQIHEGYPEFINFD